MRIRDFFYTAPFMMKNITMKASKRRRRCCHTHLTSAKIVERTEGKENKKMEVRNTYNSNKNNNNHIFNNNHNNTNNNNLQKFYTNRI